jgi:WD40 repeat protein
MILLWAVASGQLVHVLRCTSDVKHSTVSVAFNQDTTLLASCISGHTKGNRGTIEIWEVASGRLCQVLVRAGYIRSVTFSPNGTFLASNIEETVQLWEVASGQLVHVLQGGTVDSVVFSPDGTLLASGDRHGNVRLWSVGQGTLIGTYLSLPGGEWLTYIPQGYYIGSKDVEKRVVMKFERDGLLYPAELFQRDNPNPQKVAEALRGIKSNEREMAKPVPRPQALAAKPLRLLGEGHRQSS